MFLWSTSLFSREKNINQIIENLTQQGYIIAQEYLPAVKDGDVRILLMNGKVIEEKGKQAIIRRVSGEGEFRSNFALGATANSSKLTKAMQKIVDLTAPKDKLIEINVLSPGGLERFSDIGLPDFSETIIKAIERKLYYKEKFPGQFPNKILATME